MAQPTCCNSRDALNKLSCQVPRRNNGEESRKGRKEKGRKEALSARLTQKGVSRADTPNFFRAATPSAIAEVSNEARGTGERQADVPGGSGAATTETGPRIRIPQRRGG